MGNVQGKFLAGIITSLSNTTELYPSPNVEPIQTKFWIYIYSELSIASTTNAGLGA
jgi:hypothetical protein